MPVDTNRVERALIHVQADIAAGRQEHSNNILFNTTAFDEIREFITLHGGVLEGAPYADERTLADATLPADLGLWKELLELANVVEVFI